MENLNIQKLMTGSFTSKPIETDSDIVEKINTLGGSKYTSDIANIVYYFIMRRGLNKEQRTFLNYLVRNHRGDILDIVAKIYNYLNTTYDIDFHFMLIKSTQYADIICAKNPAINKSIAIYYFFVTFFYIGNLEWHWPEKFYSVGNKLCGRQIYHKPTNKNANRLGWEYGYKFED